MADLLVAGDSFAACSFDPFHRDEVDIHTSWAERLASHNNMNVVCSSHPGWNLPHCVSFTIQQIFDNPNISHCVFFTTDLLRNEILKNPADSRNMQYYVNFRSADSLHDALHTIDGTKEDHSTVFSNNIFDNPDAYQSGTTIPINQLITGALGALLFLKSVCDKHNVKLMLLHWSSPEIYQEFCENYLDQCVSINYNFLYDYREDRHLLYSPEVIGHLTDTEHEKIYKYMEQHYLEWLKNEN